MKCHDWRIRSNLLLRRYKYCHKKHQTLAHIIALQFSNLWDLTAVWTSSWKLALHTCELFHRLASLDTKLFINTVKDRHKVPVPGLRDPLSIRSNCPHSSVRDGTWPVLIHSLVPHHGSLTASSNVPQLKTAVSRQAGCERMRSPWNKFPSLREDSLPQKSSVKPRKVMWTVSWFTRGLKDVMRIMSGWRPLKCWRKAFLAISCFQGHLNLVSN